jgi:hypothetical protein
MKIEDYVGIGIIIAIIAVVAFVLYEANSAGKSLAQYLSSLFSNQGSGVPPGVTQAAPGASAAAANSQAQTTLGNMSDADSQAYLQSLTGIAPANQLANQN